MLSALAAGLGLATAEPTHHGLSSSLNAQQFPSHWQSDAQLANGAYGGKPVDGFAIDTELSDEHNTVYTKDGKAVVSYRGTDPGSLADVTSDLTIALGAPEIHPSFNHALETAQKVVTKYGKDNVRATGHSLGGTDAFYVSHKLGIPATGFNVGWSPTQVARSNIMKGWNLKNAHAFITQGDPLSAAATIQPGLQVHKVLPKQRLQNPIQDTAPELMRHVRKHFATVPLETAAGVSVGELVAAVPVVGEVVAAGLVAQAGLSAANDFGGDLLKIGKGVGQNIKVAHGMESFLPPPEQKTPMMKPKTLLEPVKAPAPTTYSPAATNSIPINTPTNSIPNFKRDALPYHSNHKKKKKKHGIHPRPKP